MQANVLEQSKELISREIKLCKKLRAMISRELEAIVLDSDMDELFRVLEQKDGIISELQLLADGWRDVLSNPVVSNSPNGLRNRLLELYPDDEELPELIKESRDIASSIMQAEDNAILELQKYKDGLRSQISSRVQGRNVAASYARMGGSMI
ncbi:MAG: hypothetical protein IJ859_01745 [Synergistaceae bacterium]|nr:hypothetical protein [Synergistaceae bacterium]